MPITTWLSPKSDELYFFRASRDLHRIDVMVADPETGSVRAVVEERMNTYQEQQAPWRLANGDLVWWSERDGWAHLYRIAPDGKVRARLTEGPWHVDGIEGVDETRGVVLFSANDREEGEDPYYRHVYRVGLDGTGLALLTPGDFDHQAQTSESAHYVVDNYSRVNTTPATALFDATGRKVMDLEEADLSLLMDAGYRFPEPYTVKAADGVTDLYGVMYKPYDFDPTKKYPIVEYVYPGPQTESVAKAFSTTPYEQGLAQFGFIVVTVGNRGGNPDRSKWYHNYGYGNLRDYGLADKKVAAEQLADRYPFIDVSRVGIYGHSGGGFMSTAAMLVYPDFFKVAVSSSGNHTNDVYNRWWSRDASRREGGRGGHDRQLRVQDRHQPGAGRQPEGAPHAHHGHRGQQRPPQQHLPDGRRAHQGQQALRLLRLPRRPPRLRRHERLLVLAALRVLRAPPARRHPMERRHDPTPDGAPQDPLGQTHRPKQGGSPAAAPGEQTCPVGGPAGVSLEATLRWCA